MVELAIAVFVVHEPARPTGLRTLPVNMGLPPEATVNYFSSTPKPIVLAAFVEVACRVNVPDSKKANVLTTNI